MTWARRLIKRLGLVAKTPDKDAETLIREAKALRRDLREVRRFEVIVRRR
jgi:hypothetical protein